MKSFIFFHGKPFIILELDEPPELLKSKKDSIPAGTHAIKFDNNNEYTVIHTSEDEDKEIDIGNDYVLILITQDLKVTSFSYRYTQQGFIKIPVKNAKDMNQHFIDTLQLEGHSYAEWHRNN